MNIICTDDEELALKLLNTAILDNLPDAKIHSFQSGKECIEFAKKNICEIAFLDIEMRDINGIELAFYLKKINPAINIIFVTGYNDYYEDAFALHSSGYVLKPVTKQKIQAELEELRNPVDFSEETNSEHIVAKTFGNFELFYKGNPIKFRRSKSKELIAYLIDRKGASVKAKELLSVLFEDKADTHSATSFLQSLAVDIKTTFNELGISDVFIKGFNSYSIKPENIDCDYYRFLKGDVTAINSFTGEYMNNYSWAEDTEGFLTFK